MLRNLRIFELRLGDHRPIDVEVDVTQMGANRHDFWLCKQHIVLYLLRLMTAVVFFDQNFDELRSECLQASVKHFQVQTLLHCATLILNQERV